MKFTILTMFKFSSVKYMHIPVQPVSKTLFMLQNGNFIPIKQTPHSPFPLVPDNYHSTFFLY